jgi:hypothetical protein
VDNQHSEPVTYQKWLDKLNSIVVELTKLDADVYITQFPDDSKDPIIILEPGTITDYKKNDFKIEGTVRVRQVYLADTKKKVTNLDDIKNNPYVMANQIGFQAMDAINTNDKYRIIVTGSVTQYDANINSIDTHITFKEV